MSQIYQLWSYGNRNRYTPVSDRERLHIALRKTEKQNLYHRGRRDSQRSTEKIAQSPLPASKTCKTPLVPPLWKSASSAVQDFDSRGSSSLLNRRERHFLSRTFGFPFPVREQTCIGIGDVILRADPEIAGNRVDPFARTFDLCKIANWGLVNHHVPSFAFPLGAEFLVPKYRLKLKPAQDAFHLVAVFYPCLGLNLDLMWPGTVAFSLVGKHPTITILPQAQKITALSEWVPRQIEQGIHLVSAWRDLPEAELAKAVG